MKDTSLAMQTRYDALLMALSPAARLARSSSMFDMAKRLVVASIRAELGPGVSALEIRKRLFLRFYGQDLTPAQRGKLFRRWEDDSARPANGTLEI